MWDICGWVWFIWMDCKLSLFLLWFWQLRFLKPVCCFQCHTSEIQRELQFKFNLFFLVSIVPNQDDAQTQTTTCLKEFFLKHLKFESSIYKQCVFPEMPRKVLEELQSIPTINNYLLYISSLPLLSRLNQSWAEEPGWCCEMTGSWWIHSPAEHMTHLRWHLRHSI